MLVWRVTKNTSLRFLWKNISELEINIQTSDIPPPFCATCVYAKLNSEFKASIEAVP